MAISLPSENEVLEQALSYFRIQFPAEDLSTDSFLGLLARIFAAEITAWNESVLIADNESPPNSKTSSIGLDNWAFVFGVSNGKGGYGRRGEFPASGGTGNVIGITGTTFTNGLTLIDSTTQIIVTLDANVFLSPAPTTSLVGIFSAVTAGLAGNLPAGSILTWQSPPAGANPTVTLINPLVGGEDIETDAELLDRILFRIRNPPKGGTAADYRVWAEESVNALGVSNGIDRAYVYPLKSGSGSVDIYITQPGSGQARAAIGAMKLAAVQAYINSKRPVTAKAYVKVPSMRNDRWIGIRFFANLNSPIYNFTWDSQGGYYQPTAYNTGTKVLTITDAPFLSNLRTAITLGKVSGIFPTIAYSSVNSRELPYILTVIDFSGTTLFTVLETSLNGLSLDFTNDRVLPGSPATIPVLTEILTYINQLGPSRASGYADINDIWASDVTIGNLAEIALDVKDASGTSYLFSIPRVGEPHGILIETPVGITGNDYPTLDIGSPEIAYIKYGRLTLNTIGP